MDFKAFLLLLTITVCHAEPPVYGVPDILPSYLNPPSLKDSYGHPHQAYGTPHQNSFKSSGHASPSQNLLVHGSPHIPVKYQELPHQPHQNYKSPSYIESGLQHLSPNHQNPSYIGSNDHNIPLKNIVVHEIPPKPSQHSYSPSVSHAIPSSSYDVPLGSHYKQPEHAVSSQNVVLKSQNQYHPQPSHNLHSLSQNIPLGSPLGSPDHLSSTYSNSIYPSAHALSYNSHNSHHDNDEHHYGLTPYKYEYQVNDDHTGDHKSHSESSDGHIVKGQFSFLQPDGKVRTVSYQADKHSGFNAQVSYSYQGHHKGY